MADYNTFSLYSLPFCLGFSLGQRILLDSFGYILNKNIIIIGFWNYLPNLITILVIIFVFRYVLKGIHFLKVSEKSFKVSGFILG
jgi:hypothetical protein